MEKNPKLEELTHVQNPADMPCLIDALQATERLLIQLVEHFREGIDPDNPESMRHIANSNRAFGADIALGEFYKAVDYHLPEL